MTDAASIDESGILGNVVIEMSLPTWEYHVPCAVPSINDVGITSTMYMYTGLLVYRIFYFLFICALFFIFLNDAQQGRIGTYRYVSIQV